MSAADLSEAFQRTLGKKLSPLGLHDVQAMLDRPELAGDQAKFTAAAMERLGKNLKPQDARQIAKVLGQFWQASISKVDIDRLVHDIIGANLSPTQLVEIFGSKQGARFATSAREGLKFFEEKKRDIENVPLDYPETIAKERMAGFAGAMARLNAATENLGITFMAANDEWLVPLVDETTKLINAFSHLDGRTLEVVSAIGAIIAPLAALKGILTTLGLVGLAPKGGGLVGRAIGGLGSAIFSPIILAGAGAGVLASTTGLNVGEDEIARQRKRNLGAFRWLGNEPPEAGKFTPWAALKPPVMELKGAARVGVDLRIDLADGLSLRELGRQSTGDVGVSMPP
jgi:hypothetical protein